MSRKKVKICDNKQLAGVDIRQRFDYSKWSHSVIIKSDYCPYER